MSFEITYKPVRKGVLLTAHGRIDSVTAETFDKTLQHAVCLRPKRIFVDASAVAYVSSKGIFALLRATRALYKDSKSNAVVTLIQPSQPIREALRLGGFDKIFRIRKHLP